MNFEDFFVQLETTPVSVSYSQHNAPRRDGLENEVLFQLPLICMVILLIAKGRRKPQVEQVGQLVGECLEASIPAFKGSSQHLGWSSNLRVRTAKALSFLELARLIEVDRQKGRVVATTLGSKAIDLAFSSGGSLSYHLTVVTREYRNISVARQLALELV